MEDISERKEEDSEPLINKGIKQNKYHREEETARDKEACKQSSLGLLVKPFFYEKQSTEQPDGRKDRVGSLSIKK